MKEISVKRNFVYNTFYQILTLLTPLVTAPYVSRVLGAAGVGTYSYTISIQMYFSLFVALGTASYGMNTIAKARDDKKKCSKLFWEIEFMTLFTTFICLIIWGIFIWSSNQYKTYFYILTLCLLATLFDISWFYSGLEQFKLIVIRNSIVKIISITAIFCFVKKKEDLGLYILIYALGMLIGNLSMWTFLSKYVDKVEIKSLNVLPHLKETLVYFVPTIATSLYTLLDKALIGVITNDLYENGYYEQATKIINMCKSVSFTAINTVMGARISYLYSNNNINEIKIRIEKSLSYILLMGYACMFGLIGISSNFVPIFFGDGYTNVIYLLYIFSPIILIIGVSNCLGAQYYTPSGKRALSAKFIIVGSLINLFLNLLLIPSLGAYGAAIASIISETIITVLYLHFCKKMITFLLILKYSWKRIISGVIMLCFLMLISDISKYIFVTLLMQIVLGGVIYFVILFVLNDELVFNFTIKVFNRLKGR